MTVVTSRERRTSKRNNICFLFRPTPVPMQCAPFRASEKMGAPCFPIYFVYTTFISFFREKCAPFTPCFEDRGHEGLE
jgi:hypothetical protein